MAIRLSGLASGMDTDTIIKGIVDAQKLKNKKVSDKSQILDWKKDKLKELNTKLYKLYSEDLTKLRMASAYGTKKVTSSNESLVEVKAGSTAPTGTMQLKITNTATAQSVTSGKFDSTTTSSTKLKDLPGYSSGSAIIITNDSKEKVLEITDKTTIGDFVSACKDAGLNASFDTNQKRIFISSKESGVENQFSIREYSNTSIEYFDKIKEAIDYSKLNSVQKEKVLKEFDTLQNSSSLTDDQKQQITKNIVSIVQDSVKATVESEAKQTAITKVIDGIKEELVDGYSVSDSPYDGVVNYNDILAELGYEGTLTTEQETKASNLYKQYCKVYDELKSNIIVPDDVQPGDVEEYKKDTAKKQYEKLVALDKENYFNNLAQKKFTSTEVKEGDKTYAQYYQEQVNIEYNKIDINNKVTDAINSLSNDINTIISGYNGSSSKVSVLSALNMGEVSNTDIIEGGSASGMVIKAATDAEITYNGVAMTSSSNTIKVNDYTITLKGRSDEVINISTTVDSQGTFDAVKKFVTNYNAILKELNTLYYADSARGYDPLSDDEKEAMTEAQIEKWETKIKDSMLRRDSNVGTIITTLKTSLMQSVEGSDGKTYSLASFGIGTSSDYSEKGLLHIDGDPDDAAFSTMANKLMSALESNPDIVADVLSKTVTKLYEDIDKNIKAIPNVRSAFTFYNDKLMTNQQTEYKKKISLLESKLTDLENKYYKQFSAMETAMAKLQSQSNALAGMLGTGSN